MIDRGNDRDDYVQAVAAQAALVNNAALTPSARILQDLGDTGSGFFLYALDAARNNKQYFAALEPLQGERLKMFVDEANSSVRRQADIEASDNISLDDYLGEYFSTGR